MLKLDYTIESPEERKKLVEQILQETPEPTEAYLDSLANYLILCMEKQEKKQKKILTNNRMQTVNKRETSFEGLVSQLENGEDGIYNLINENKQVIFQPKVSITKQDLEEIPFLKQIKEAIEFWESKQKTAVGRDAYIIKKALIDLRKDQYVIKNAYRRPIIFTKMNFSKAYPKMEAKHTINKNGYVRPEGVSLCDPKVCGLILQNYSRLKEEGYGNFESDLYYLMEDFDALSAAALDKYPLYKEIMICKIDGIQNYDIQKLLNDKFGICHSLEYISSLWRKKIPNLIASAAEDQYLNWYYLEKEKGIYKKCSKCGKIKLAHNKYFSKNKTSKDGYYSICKDCRNKKDDLDKNV